MNNIIPFPHRMKRTEKPVPKVCELAADQFEKIIILGTHKNDSLLQMITTIKDPAEILWHLESAKITLLHGFEEDE
tara:strand:+ start:175 stop:402 length:228 start_codon:yes stop_codon:yes gene_type:complete